MSFLKWLETKYDGRININGDIPSSKLNKIVENFCKELNWKNSPEFLKTVKGLHTGKVNRNWLIKLFPFLFKNANQNQRLSLNYLLERYNLVKYHGIFLFEKNHDFPKFIYDYWKDLHYLTEDYIDIYYSFDDLQEKISAYQILSQANHLNSGKPPDDVSQSTVYEAVAKLLAIKEASEKKDQQEQVKTIANWRQWFNGIGKNAQNYLSVTADAVSLGLPLLRLLGLPVP